eukprot:Selendium_serpulae@DN831_c0_g1_i1.p1
MMKLGVLTVFVGVVVLFNVFITQLAASQDPFDSRAEEYELSYVQSVIDHGEDNENSDVHFPYDEVSDVDSRVPRSSHSVAVNPQPESHEPGVSEPEVSGDDVYVALVGHQPHIKKGSHHQHGPHGGTKGARPPTSYTDPYEVKHVPHKPPKYTDPYEVKHVPHKPPKYTDPYEV